MCLSSTNMTYASDNKALTEDYANTFSITHQTASSKMQTHNLPIEVAEYINEVLEKHPDAEIIVSTPYNKPSTRAGEEVGVLPAPMEDIH